MTSAYSPSPLQVRFRDERKKRSIRLKMPAPHFPASRFSKYTHLYKCVFERWPDSFAKKSVESIIDEVAAKHGLTRNEIISPRRAAYIVAARQEAMCRARYETAYSFPAIARAFRRDHTTVIHGVRAHEKRTAEGF